MNLTIDIGNTFVKAALFSINKIIDSQTKPIAELDFFIKKIVKEFSVENIILSSVINHPQELDSFLASKYHFILLDHTTRLPFLNEYLSPETLGKDRIGAVAGACAEFANQNVLVIDAGTCIKYDFINSNNEYLGGAISPGIKMRYAALNNYTQKLPLLEPSSGFLELTGNSTIASIHSGVQLGAVAEVNEIINLYTEKHKNLAVILTGGDMLYLKPVMSGKNNIFADSFLIHKGLNHILKYNVDI
ncbi:MAG: type III pantothenate kinase [Bacteroidetes bacterium]|nr:type III pantothenate kinase [Bacteroidota bacterium]HET6243460.1 type III pantothenate kinase [Bacteroidia bacterium]